MKTEFNGNIITITLSPWEKEIVDYINTTYGPLHIQKYLIRMLDSKSRGKLETEIRREFLERESRQPVRNPGA